MATSRYRRSTSIATHSFAAKQSMGLIATLLSPLLRTTPFGPTADTARRLPGFGKITSLRARSSTTTFRIGPGGQSLSISPARLKRGQRSDRLDRFIAPWLLVGYARFGWEETDRFHDAMGQDEARVLAQDLNLRRSLVSESRARGSRRKQ